MLVAGSPSLTAMFPNPMSHEIGVWVCFLELRSLLLPHLTCRSLWVDEIAYGNPRRFLTTRTGMGKRFGPRVFGPSAPTAHFSHSKHPMTQPWVACRESGARCEASLKHAEVEISSLGIPTISRNDTALSLGASRKASCKA